MQEVLNRKEAAEFLNVSLRTIDRLPIPRAKVGRATRFLKDDLSEFLRQNRKVPDTYSPKLSPKIALSKPRQKALDNEWITKKKAMLH